MPGSGWAASITASKTKATAIRALTTIRFFLTWSEATIVESAIFLFSRW